MTPRLMIACATCGRARYIRSALPDGQSLEDAAKSMRCHSCHSTAVSLSWITPDPLSGKWPAERGER